MILTLICLFTCQSSQIMRAGNYATTAEQPFMNNTIHKSYLKSAKITIQIKNVIFFLALIEINPWDLKKTNGEQSFIVCLFVFSLIQMTRLRDKYYKKQIYFWKGKKCITAYAPKSITLV